MPEKTSISSPNSRQHCSECCAGGPARLICPEGLPGLELCVAHKSARVQPRHAHDSFIMGLVTAGVRRIETAGQSVVVRTGEAFALPPGLAHSCAPAGGVCSYLAFSLTREALPKDARWWPPLRMADAGLARALLRLAEACDTPCGPLERQSLLAGLLEGIGTVGTSAQPPSQEDAGMDAAVLAAKSLLAANLEPGLGLPALAEACGADMYALHRAFTRIVGLPPHAFQTQQRLRRAKALLRAGASLTDAALAAGFCDQSHMHRHFTRLVGFTPAQYACAHKARGETS
ncbi:MAG: helix-turn-helix domain-containing protein [Humidesulfovibrio sp.]|nr:helix-turn-helix domain-containing protein [Humidesulfovibrio sp.]